MIDAEDLTARLFASLLDELRFIRERNALLERENGRLEMARAELADRFARVASLLGSVERDQLKRLEEYSGLEH